MIHGDALTKADSSVWRITGSPLVSGSADGTLARRTVAVKDTYAVAGHRIGAGNPSWLAEAPIEERHAAAVNALLEAGADVLGIAQTVELAFSLSGINSHYGTPPNPTGQGRVPGGSSSGPASAVASGLVDIGLGSDTAGSIRVPAAYCGLFGQRVTHSAVSTAGLLPLAPEFDTVGWLTRDAKTLNAVASVLLPENNAEGANHLIVAADLFDLADPLVGEVLRKSTNRFVAQTGLPHDWVPVLSGNHVEDWVSAFGTVQAVQGWQIHGAWLDAHPQAVSEEISQRFNRGRGVTPAQLAEAQVLLTRARELMAELLPPGTVLVQPAASTTAPPSRMSEAAAAAMRARTLGLTALASMAGLPVVTIPGGDVEGLPVGLCLVGSPGSDRALSTLATLVS